MHSWLLVKFRTEKARKTLPRLIARHCRSVLYFEPSHVFARFIAEDVLLFSARQGDPLGLGAPVFTRNAGGSAVFDGVVARRSTASPLTSQLLLDLLESVPLSSLYSHVAGEFSVGFFDTRDCSLYGFGDFAGLKPNFFLESRDVFAISNEQKLLNPICTGSSTPDFDPVASASLVSQGNKFGFSSVLRGVRLIEAGCYVKCGPDNKVTHHRFSDTVYGRGDAVTPRDYDQAAEALVANFNWLGKINALEGKPIPLSLTGGADSRLMLAIALNSQIRDRIETFTYGNPNNPDMQLAPLVAKAAHVPHRADVTIPKVRHNDMQACWELMQHRAFLYLGQQGPFDGTRPQKISTDAIDVTGLFSEAFRRVRPVNASVNLSDVQTAIAHLSDFQQPHDPYNILSDTARAFYSREVETFVETQLASGASLNELPELYYIKNRIPWWAGALNSITPTTRIAPLASIDATRIALSQSLYDRSNGRFMFEMMIRLAPHLLELPLVGKTYAAEYAAGWSSKLKVASTPFKVQRISTSGSTAVASPPPWQVEIIKKYPGMIADYLLADQGSKIFDLVDAGKLRAVLMNLQKADSHHKLKSILALTETAIALQGDWIVGKMGEDKPIDSYEIDTNLDAFKLGKTLLNHVRTPVISYQSLRGPLPDTSMLKRIRIDPFRNSGSSVCLLGLKLFDWHGQQVANIELDQGRFSPSIAKSENHLTGGLTLEYRGSTPMMIFDAPEQEHAWSQAAYLELQFQKIASDDAIDIFFDTGNGFTRDGMLTSTY